jgi:hypothetical protein
MATTFLTERLLKAAEVLLFHGEIVEICYVGPGKRRSCMLVGRAKTAGYVRLAIWVTANEIQEGRHGVKYTDCLLPVETAVRLEQLAREQEPQPSRELARKMEFIARARRQRTRNGRYADGVHGCERAGRI